MDEWIKALFQTCASKANMDYNRNGRTNENTEISQEQRSNSWNTSKKHLHIITPRLVISTKCVFQIQLTNGNHRRINTVNENVNIPNMFTIAAVRTTGHSTTGVTQRS